MTYSQEEQDSGPFCQHWDDPASCIEECVSCDHTCAAHDDEGECNNINCECVEWADEADGVYRTL